MKNELATAVREVLEDFPNGYKNLLGEPGDSSFSSRVLLPEAEAVQFVQHSLNGRAVISWQTRLLTNEDHKIAKKRFRASYQQLQGLSVKLGPRAYKLRSPYEDPGIDQKFAAIVFELEPSNSYTESIKVEVQLLFQMPMEWVVAVLIYDRDRKDNEPGRTLRSF
ncbi:MAG: hypothetical protein FJX92_01395 [Bacteroidetes bacterium]|nr:hypothetical protein [Bacteroidota bacterium]